RASIRAHDRMAAFNLQPLLVPTDRAFEVRDADRFHVGEDSRVHRDRSLVADEPLEFAYLWPAVLPGRYRLEIGSRGIRRPLLVVHDVVVVDGERTATDAIQHLTVPGLQVVELDLPQAAAIEVPPNTRL